MLPPRACNRPSVRDNTVHKIHFIYMFTVQNIKNNKIHVKRKRIPKTVLRASVHSARMELNWQCVIILLGQVRTMLEMNNSRVLS